MSFFDRFKALDVYRDIPKDLKMEATATGATVSVACAVAIVYLFVSEFVFFLTPEVSSQMFVDNRDHASIKGLDHALLQINMNISVPAVPCAVISVDAQDVMGSHVVDVGGLLHKTRLNGGTLAYKLDRQGHPLAVEGGDPLQQKGEGCNIQGTMIVKRVPGNFHISAHAHAHLLNLFFQNDPMNLTHIVHSLSFGEHAEEAFDVSEVAINPLGGASKVILEQKEGEAKSFEYYVKVVPMVYERYGETLDSFQYVSNSNEILGRYTIPAVYFRYDLSPITVKFTRKSRSFTHFLVQICAIIGGVFTVLGLLNSFVRSSVRVLFRKAEQGKLG